MCQTRAKVGDGVERTLSGDAAKDGPQAEKEGRLPPVEQEPKHRRRRRLHDKTGCGDLHGAHAMAFPHDARRLHDGSAQSKRVYTNTEAHRREPDGHDHVGPPGWLHRLGDAYVHA